MSGGIRIESATIRILRTEFGRFPHILPLNPELRPGSPSLRVTLEVEWAPPDAVPLLRRYQQELSGLLPELRRHRCRGPAHYHIARMGEGVEETEPDARGNDALGPVEAPPVGVEPALALVHLAEHLAIDVIAFVTELGSVSGVTAAQASSETRYELFVECPQAPCALAVYWAPPLAILLRGDRSRARRILLRWRTLYRHRERPGGGGLACTQAWRRTRGRGPRPALIWEWRAASPAISGTAPERRDRRPEEAMTR
jgi:hypothetical protein